MREYLYAILVLTALSPLAASAQRYPIKPIRVLIGFPPGGGEDFHARTVASKLTDLLGQPVIVDHRPGAGGAIAWEQVVKSAPDGYTLTITGGGLTAAPSIYPKFPFDPARDLAAVAQFSEHQYMLVAHPSVPATNVKQLIGIAGKSPGKLNYSSSGIGSMPHLAGALFVSKAKVNVVHVPYKGGSASLIDVIAGQCDMTIGTIPSVQPHVKAGRVKILATGARKRTAAIPDVPTVSETVPGYDLLTWYGMWYPKRTSPDIVTRMHAELAKVLALPEVARSFDALGVEPASSTPAELESYVKAETERWRKVIATAGIRLE